MQEGEKKIAVLFPGQGSQFVGMGREFVETDSGAAALLDRASELAGVDMKKLCLDGPMADLTRTLYLQPAVTCINLMVWQALARAGVRPTYFAGHSLGEYSALAAAEVLSIDDTLRLVTERGRLMEREAATNPGGMTAVLGLSLAAVEDIVGRVSAGIVTAANYNCLTQIVLSGETNALAEAAKLVATEGGKAIPLKVSGAWHSPLVAGAVVDFITCMEGMTFSRPKVPVLFNVIAQIEDNPLAIQGIMARQISSMVRWTDIIARMVNDGVRIFIEAGPKNVLTGLLKKNLPVDYEHTTFQIDTPDKLATCLAAIGMV